jgi:hypothetical protein
MDSFLSQENKAMLWGIMSELPQFNEYCKRDVGEAQKHFERELERISSTMHLSSDTMQLVEQNKLFLKSFKNHLQIVQSQSQKIQAQSQTQYPSFTTVTRENIQNNRLNQFENRLHTMQQDFDKHIPKPPQNIDFSDKNERETPSGDEMDSLLKETMARRNLELSEITNKQNTGDSMEAKKWLNREINVGEDVDISTQDITTTIENSKKKVSWADDNSANTTTNTNPVQGGTNAVYLHDFMINVTEQLSNLQKTLNTIVDDIAVINNTDNNANKK